MKKKWTCILLILVFCVPSIVLAGNLDFAEDRGILLYEEKSDSVLFEKNAEERFYPASTTKIMTALLVLEHMKLEDEITVGEEITFISRDSSKADLKQGEILTVEELLYGLLVASGNDVAYTLAAHVGSTVGKVDEVRASIDYFVEMMNEKARELGANDTHFVNPHGLHDENHYSSPKDILVFTKELLQYDTAKDIVNTPVYSLVTNTSTHKWTSTNVFLHNNWDAVPYVSSIGPNQYFIPEVHGVKTGFTNEAGRCVVFTAHKDGLDLIGLIYKSIYEEIWREGIDLMDFAVENYDNVSMVSTGEEISNLALSNPADSFPDVLSVIVKEDIAQVLKTEDKDRIQKSVEYNPDILKQEGDHTYRLKQDIYEDQVIGKVTFSLEDRVIAEGDLYSAYQVDKRGVFDFLLQWPWVLLGILILLLLVRITIVKNKGRNKKKRKRKV